MIETVFDSERLPAGERFASWYEMTRHALISTRVRSEDAADFRASARVIGTNTFQVSTEVVRSPLRADRTAKHIRQSDPEQYLLGVIRTGTHGFSQRGREATVGVGDLVLFDSSQPFRACYEGGAHQMFFLPKAVLPLPATEVAMLLATPLSGRDGIGGILSQCLREILREPAPYRAAEIIRLFDIALELLTTLLAHELHALRTLPPESHRQALLARVHTFIHQNLGDPDLSPQTVAEAHHVSLRHLQQLLATADTTPASMIRRKRLEQCRRALMDPRQSRRAIHAIAARWGFTDAAHFSRLFRATYGASPSEFRVAHESLVGGATGGPRE
ncbi:helix-turn-helix domain-containing protein [Streptomyces sp. NPDC021354]|uniref:helix-turn-helix domain-containing protein n=1 Tax=Streptomyces sp. NPDC021354 TaxID=3154793 RepID=UPI0033C0C98C